MTDHRGWQASRYQMQLINSPNCQRANFCQRQRRDFLAELSQTLPQLLIGLAFASFTLSTLGASLASVNPSRTTFFRFVLSIGFKVTSRKHDFDMAADQGIDSREEALLLRESSRAVSLESGN